MSSEFAIKVEGLSKCYQIYEKPRDRLTQFMVPPMRQLFGQQKRQYFREFWALRNVNFELKKGESIGILGRNGSGKSTLLQLITGTLAPTTGSVETNGRIAALLELGAGFNPEFSGRENVFLNLALQGFNKNQIEEKFEDVAAFADIGDFIDQSVKTYSSGMYARLAFAAAIHADPEVLIVDEILAVGDAPFQQKCINRLYRILDDGVSILMVSHDAYQVRSICGKALLLQRGEQILYDSSAKVMDEYIASNGRSDSFVPKFDDPLESPINANDEISSVNTEAGFGISINNPTLVCKGVREVGEINSQSELDLEFNYCLNGVFNENVSFVINLYREDGIYIFGTTTKMQGLAEFTPAKKGRVRVHFPSLTLVSGKYNFRVAINDGRGLNILAEAVPVCHFTVIDEFKAVGVLDIPHSWTHECILPI